MGISINEASAGQNQPQSSMRVLELRDYDGRAESLAVVEKAVPRPGKGEVLVRISASPVNPSDLAFLQGLYGIKKTLPVVPGLEASGRVVEAGGGFLARSLLNKRVACSSPIDGDGTWAEYMLTQASLCIPLIKEITDEQGATTIVNPLTAWALMQMAKRARSRAVVQTAAASALGQMIESLGRRFRLPVINIVRRDEQLDLLKSRGAQYVLNSNAEDFDERLRELCRELKATIAFDAVAGELTGRVLSAMGGNARIIVYGALSGAGCVIDPRSLIFDNKRVEGFWLSKWLRSQSTFKMLRMTRQVQRLLAGDLKTEIRSRLTLEEAPAGIREYAKHMTGGKVLIVPGLKK